MPPSVYPGGSGAPPSEPLPGRGGAFSVREGRPGAARPGLRLLLPRPADTQGQSRNQLAAAEGQAETGRMLPIIQQQPGGSRATELRRRRCHRDRRQSSIPVGPARGRTGPKVQARPSSASRRGPATARHHAVHQPPTGSCLRCTMVALLARCPRPEESEGVRNEHHGIEEGFHTTPTARGDPQDRVGQTANVVKRTKAAFRRNTTGRPLP